MGPGGIATIIASCALMVNAIAVAYVIIRLGRLIDEVHTTVTLVNGPLKSINRITKNAEDLSDKVNEATTSFINKNGSAVKVAGALLSAASMKKSRSKKKAE